MAKSFFAMDQDAGFDMSNEAEMREFMYVYNATRARAPLPAPIGHTALLPTDDNRTARSKRGSEAKRQRKIAKAARKRNRKRK